jgi:hypothetical protein
MFPSSQVFRGAKYPLGSWMMPLVFLVLAGMAAYFRADLRQSLVDLSNAQFWSAGWAIVYAVAIAAALIRASESWAEFLLWFLLGATGAGLGWVFGMAITPVSDADAARFAAAPSVVPTAIGALAIAAITTIWSKLTEGDQPKILQRPYLIAVGIALSAFLISLAVQINLRSYGNEKILMSVLPPGAVRGQVSLKEPVEPYEIFTFQGWASYPEEMRVEWSVNDEAAKVVKIGAEDGRFCVFEPAKVDDKNKNVVVTARSVWNKSLVQTMRLQLKPLTEAEAAKPGNIAKGALCQAVGPRAPAVPAPVPAAPAARPPGGAE